MLHEERQEANRREAQESLGRARREPEPEPDWGQEIDLDR